MFERRRSFGRNMASLYRVAGGGGDNRHSGGDVAACAIKGKGKSKRGGLHE